MEKSKRKIRIDRIIVLLVILVISFFTFFKIYNYLRVKFAKIDVVLVNNRKIEFNDKIKVSKFIKKINGKIINDYVIDATKLGEKEVKFYFINDDNIKVNYTFNVKVVDTTKPVIWLTDSYNISKGSKDTLLEDIMCGDNYDNSPNKTIDGSYDLNTVGTYPLIYKAIDSSGNKTERNFTLNVYEKPKEKSSVVTKGDNIIDTSSGINFLSVKENYKTDKTKIGIDVSHWQGDIDFKKIKDAGVEFIMIKLGGTDKKREKYIDSKFNYNIKQANKYKIKTGIYYFSYAKNEKEAKKDAKWVLKQIKKYDIDLPVVFDWEDWTNFNSYNLSFFGLNNISYSFLDTINKKGYKGMIYGSKTYLEEIWQPLKYDVWLAHYVNKTDYKGKYKMWQICDDGYIDGINGFVDIDIMYK